MDKNHPSQNGLSQPHVHYSFLKTASEGLLLNEGGFPSSAHDSLESDSESLAREKQYQLELQERIGDCEMLLSQSYYELEEDSLEEDSLEENPLSEAEEPDAEEAQISTGSNCGKENNSSKEKITEWYSEMRYSPNWKNERGGVIMESSWKSSLEDAQGSPSASLPLTSSPSQDGPTAVDHHLKEGWQVLSSVSDRESLDSCTPPPSVCGGSYPSPKDWEREWEAAAAYQYNGPTSSHSQDGLRAMDHPLKEGQQAIPSVSDRESLNSCAPLPSVSGGSYPSPKDWEREWEAAAAYQYNGPTGSHSQNGLRAMDHPLKEGQQAIPSVSDRGSSNSCAPLPSVRGGSYPSPKDWEQEREAAAAYQYNGPTGSHSQNGLRAMDHPLKEGQQAIPSVSDRGSSNSCAPLPSVRGGSYPSPKDWEQEREAAAAYQYNGPTGSHSQNGLRAMDHPLKEGQQAIPSVSDRGSSNSCAPLPSVRGGSYPSPKDWEQEREAAAAYQYNGPTGSHSQNGLRAMDHPLKEGQQAIPSVSDRGSSNSCAPLPSVRGGSYPSPKDWEQEREAAAAYQYNGPTGSHSQNGLRAMDHPLKEGQQAIPSVSDRGSSNSCAPLPSVRGGSYPSPKDWEQEREAAAAYQYNGPTGSHSQNGLRAMDHPLKEGQQAIPSVSDRGSSNSCAPLPSVRGGSYPSPKDWEQEREAAAAYQYNGPTGSHSQNGLRAMDHPLKEGQQAIPSVSDRGSSNSCAPLPSVRGGSYPSPKDWEQEREAAAAYQYNGPTGSHSQNGLRAMDHPLKEGQQAIPSVSDRGSSNSCAPLPSVRGGSYPSPKDWEQEREAAAAYQYNGPTGSHSQNGLRAMDHPLKEGQQAIPSVSDRGSSNSCAPLPSVRGGSYPSPKDWEQEREAAAAYQYNGPTGSHSQNGLTAMDHPLKEGRQAIPSVSDRGSLNSCAPPPSVHSGSYPSPKDWEGEGEAVAAGQCNSHSSIHSGGSSTQTKGFKQQRSKQDFIGKNKVTLGLAAQKNSSYLHLHSKKQRGGHPGQAHQNKGPERRGADSSQGASLKGSPIQTPVGAQVELRGQQSGHHNELELENTPTNSNSSTEVSNLEQDSRTLFPCRLHPNPPVALFWPSVATGAPDIQFHAGPIYFVQQDGKETSMNLTSARNPLLLSPYPNLLVFPLPCTGENNQEVQQNTENSLGYQQHPPHRCAFPKPSSLPRHGKHQNPLGQKKISSADDSGLRLPVNKGLSSRNSRNIYSEDICSSYASGEPGPPQPLAHNRIGATSPTEWLIQEAERRHQEISRLASMLPPVMQRGESDSQLNLESSRENQPCLSHSNSEGCLLQVEKQNERKEKENRKVSRMKGYIDMDMKLGGLGPDYETIREKAEKIKQQKEYAKHIKEHNMKNIISVRKPPPRPENKLVVSRQKALEYAKSIPKPKIVLSKPSEQEPKDEKILAHTLNGENLPPISSLESLQNRHEREKQVVAAFKNFHIV